MGVKENKIHYCPDAWVTFMGWFLSREPLFYKCFPALCLSRCIHQGSCYLLNYLRLLVRRRQDKLLSEAGITSPSGSFCLDQLTPGAELGESWESLSAQHPACFPDLDGRLRGDKGQWAAGVCERSLSVTTGALHLWLKPWVESRGHSHPVCILSIHGGLGWEGLDNLRATSAQGSKESITPLKLAGGRASSPFGYHNVGSAVEGSQQSFKESSLIPTGEKTTSPLKPA